MESRNAERIIEIGYEDEGLVNKPNYGMIRKRWKGDSTWIRSEVEFSASCSLLFPGSACVQERIKLLLGVAL